MSDQNMERQVELAMMGWPEYEVEGDEYTEPQRAKLESFPHQAQLKAYLVAQGYIEFSGKRRIDSKKTQQSKFFNVLGRRGNLAWCCDPDCDRVIVDIPISLFINSEKGGEIAQHEECFLRNLRAGYYIMQSGKDEGKNVATNKADVEAFEN